MTRDGPAVKGRATIAQKPVEPKRTPLDRGLFLSI